MFQTYPEHLSGSFWSDTKRQYVFPKGFCSLSHESEMSDWAFFMIISLPDAADDPSWFECPGPTGCWKTCWTLVFVDAMAEVNENHLIWSWSHIEAAIEVVVVLSDDHFLFFHFEHVYNHFWE